MLPLNLLAFANFVAATPTPRVLNITYSGTSCEPNTSSVNYGYYEPTSTIRLTETLYEFHPYIGPGTKISDRTRQCGYRIDFALEEAYALRADVSGVFVRGFAGQLGIKDTMLVRSNMSWIGGVDAPSVTELVQGQVISNDGRFENTTLPQGTTQNTTTVYKGTTSRCGGGTLVWDFRATIRPGSSQPGGGWDDRGEGENLWYAVNDVEVRLC